jgi:hypothetical protein
MLMDGAQLGKRNQAVAAHGDRVTAAEKNGIHGFLDCRERALHFAARNRDISQVDGVQIDEHVGVG